MPVVSQFEGPYGVTSMMTIKHSSRNVIHDRIIAVNKTVCNGIWYISLVGFGRGAEGHEAKRVVESIVAELLLQSTTVCAVYIMQRAV